MELNMARSKLSDEVKMELTELLVNSNWGPFLYLGSTILEKWKDKVSKVDPMNPELVAILSRYQGARDFFREYQDELLKLKKKNA